MKFKLFIVVILLSYSNLFSQDSNFNVELNYPLPIDDNFIGRNYNGIIEAGLRYRFVNTSILNVGIALNSGVLENTNSDNEIGIDVTVVSVQPRVFAELDIEALPSFHPSVALGYSYMNFKSKNFSDTSVEDANTLDSKNGFNFNFGIAYDITKTLFIQAQYDFVKLTVNNGVPNTRYNTEVNMLKLGLGYRL